MLPEQRKHLRRRIDRYKGDPENARIVNSARLKLQNDRNERLKFYAAVASPIITLIGVVIGFIFR